MADGQEDNKYIATQTAISLAAETLVRQFGIGHHDARFAMMGVLLSTCHALAPKAIRQVVLTRIDLDTAMSTVGRPGLERALRRHEEALAAWYGEALARQAKREGRMN